LITSFYQTNVDQFKFSIDSIRDWRNIGDHVQRYLHPSLFSLLQ